jgi:hypothetical protein
MVLFRKKKEELEGGIDQEVAGGVGEDGIASSPVSWDEGCAWCLAEQGVVSQSGSHGICLRHEEQVYQSYLAMRRGGR